jgi:hypothetical protein
VNPLLFLFLCHQLVGLEGSASCDEGVMQGETLSEEVLFLKEAG